MKPHATQVLSTLVFASAPAVAADAQSIVEVARQERLRREAIARQAGPAAASPKVYTDADLVYSGRLTVRVGDVARDASSESGAAPSAPGSAPSESGSAPSESGSAPSESGAAPSAPGSAPAPPGDAEAADEQQWRDRMTAARQALERAEHRAAELQTRVNGLWADFTGRDDPAQRAVVEQERHAALAELDETRAEAEELAQAVADLRAEARRAGVPPGWLRPGPAR